MLHTTMAKSFYKMSEAYCTIMLSSDELARLHLFSLTAPKGSPGTIYKADWQPQHDLQGWLAVPQQPTRLTGRQGPVTSFWQAGILRMVTDDKKEKKQKTQSPQANKAKQHQQFYQAIQFVMAVDGYG